MALGGAMTTMKSALHMLRHRGSVTAAFGLIILLVMGVLSSCVGTPELNPSTVREVVALASTCEQPRQPRTITALGGTAPIYYPDDTDPTTPHPLLVSLHPFLLGAYDWDHYSQFVAEATRRGYIVILPEGRNPGPGWSVPGGNRSDFDDVGWVDALIQEAARTACVDSSRIYAAGFSAGAALAVGLSCELSSRFAAVAGSGGTNLTSLCPQSGATRAMIMHGTEDMVVPITGNIVPFAAAPPISVDSVVDSFATRNHCSAHPVVTQPTSTQVRRDYECTDAALVDIRVLGMGHTWPGAFGLIDVVVGPNDQSFSATTTVLDFFDATP